MASEVEVLHNLLLVGLKGNPLAVKIQKSAEVARVADILLVAGRILLAEVELVAVFGVEPMMIRAES